MQKNIVIVGGGAGGLELATKLGHKLGKKKLAHITLVDASLIHLWKPLWHEVAAGTLHYANNEVDYVAHASANYYEFVLGKMDGLDRTTRQIHLAPEYDADGHEIIARRLLSYDILIIAVGSVSNDFNTLGANEYCLYLDGRQQAYNFQKIFLTSLLHLQYDTRAANKDPLTIVIIGGGATGVELAAELFYALKQVARYGWKKVGLEKNVKISVVEAADRLLSALPERISDMAERELKQRQISVYKNQRVVKVTADHLVTDHGLVIPAKIKLWAAGIKAPNFLSQLDGLEVNRINQLVVKPTLQTTLDDKIFAFGDCAQCPIPNSDQFVPPRAQAAHQQANLLTRSLMRLINDQSLLSFVYRDRGSLISLSHQTALGNLMGNLGIRMNISFEGKLARWAYVMLYKLHQLTLFGCWKLGLLSIGNFLSRRVTPRLKLH